VWARFETELTKRTADIEQRHKDELHALSARTKELETAARIVEQQRGARSSMPIAGLKTLYGN
jgi:hypothetical protein